MKACVACGGEITHRFKRWYCGRCRAVLRRIRNEFSTAIYRACRDGVLPSLKTLSCVDCGAPAGAYDHRDYWRPLDVEPTCFRCNQLRGPATTLINGIEHITLEAA